MKFVFEGYDCVYSEDEDETLEYYPPNAEVVSWDSEGFMGIMWKIEFEADNVDKAREYVNKHFEAQAFDVYNDKGESVFT